MQLILSQSLYGKIKIKELKMHISYFGKERGNSQKRRRRNFFFFFHFKNRNQNKKRTRCNLLMKKKIDF
ncbi:MAG: hypothetical protein B6I28_00960 [Fusobacteriia bacterium 4572_132]|nr:MAG: hypothetical protein B6I28_00960 [Fusobacteriia bacterium 4572_132]